MWHTRIAKIDIRFRWSIARIHTTPIGRDRRFSSTILSGKSILAWWWRCCCRSYFCSFCIDNLQIGASVYGCTSIPFEEWTIYFRSVTNDEFALSKHRSQNRRSHLQHSHCQRIAVVIGGLMGEKRLSSRELVIQSILRGLHQFLKWSRSPAIIRA